MCVVVKLNSTLKKKIAFDYHSPEKKKLYLNHIMDLIKDCGIDMVYMFIIEREKELPCVLFFQLFSILFLPEI